MFDWKIMGALGLLAVAILIGFVICIVASVSLYAKKFAEQPEDKRRGFEVKPTTTDTADNRSAVQRERDDHHG
jgi:type III secretory pathway component EscT